MSEAQEIPDLAWDTADKLRKALRFADLSVGEMSDYLGVSRNTVGRYINGHVTPDRRTLRLWALRCGVPMDWLTDNETNGSHITVLIRDQQPGYADIQNDITAMRKALGHGQRRPNARAGIADTSVIPSSEQAM